MQHHERKAEDPERVLRAQSAVLLGDPGRRYRLSGNGRELARILYDLNRWAEQAGVSSLSELA